MPPETPIAEAETAEAETAERNSLFTKFPEPRGWANEWAPSISDRAQFDPET